MKQDSNQPPAVPDWRRAKIKVLFSLAISGFLLGLMLGQLKDDQQQEIKLLSLQQQDSAGTLRLCFSTRPEVRQQRIAGAHLWRFARVTPGKAQQGQLLSQTADTARWLLSWDEHELQLGITMVRDFSVGWQWQGGSACAEFVAVLPERRKQANRQISADANHQ